MKVFTTPRFERRLVKFIKGHPDLSGKISQIMKRLASDYLSSELKVHRLSGPLKDCLAYNLSYDYRLVFTIDDEGLCFIDVGTHDDVYR